MTTDTNGWRVLPLRLHPVARVLWVMERVGVEGSVQRAAKASLEKRQQGTPPAWACRGVPGDVVIDDFTVPTRDGEVVVRRYRAADAVGEQPAVLYAHGGGWIMGGLDGVDRICRRLALHADVTVISIDYRLAPEHRFPAGLHDCADVLRWVRGEAAALDVDPSRIAVAGDSAGGNLVAALTLLDRESTPPLRAQVLIYPVLDATLSSAYVQSFRGPPLSRRHCQLLVEQYLGPRGDASNPLASPLLADDLSKLPAALVLTGGADILANDGMRYVERLLEAGTSASLRHYPRAPHGFVAIDRLLPEAATALDEMTRFLRLRLRADIGVGA